MLPDIEPFEIGDVVTSDEGKRGTRVGVIMGIGPMEYRVNWIFGQGCLCYGCLNRDYYKKIGNVPVEGASNIRVRKQRAKRSP